MHLQDLPSRPRRNRRSPTIRHASSETHLSPSNLILPVFVHDGEKNSPIASMPGVDRLGWRHGLIDAVQEARSHGVNQVVIFPKVPFPVMRSSQHPPAMETLLSSMDPSCCCLLELKRCLLLHLLLLHLLLLLAQLMTSGKAWS